VSTFAAVVITLLAPLSVALVLITLPGTWVLLALAAVLELWRGDLIGWDTLGACAALALFGEIVEFAASALGAAKAGGSKRAAVGSMLGALVGAILGAPLLFPLGPIIGGAVGAGVGALIAERTVPTRGWKHSAKVGTGAAIGRLIATACKSAIAAIVAIIVVVAVWW
jgi:uncharacterized protein YqgC (DUF456 family)